MGVFNRYVLASGFRNEICCNESNYLIWKWRPSSSQPGENQQENAIRWGSSLRVKDGEVAVFIHRQKNGTIEEFIEGPYDQILSRKNLQAPESVFGLAYEDGVFFRAEVYFINLARLIQVRFAVPFFDVYDPRFSDIGVPVAVRGTISFGIRDYREFVKLHRMDTFTLSDFEKKIRDSVCRYVKDAVSNAPTANNIPVVQIESKIAQINDAIEYDLTWRQKDTLGVTVFGVDIGAIEIDKTSTGYRQLMAITKDVTAATVQAQTAANIKDIHDKQRIEAEHYQESLRVQREEDQYAQRMHTRQTNLGAYQTEKQAEVGVAGAVPPPVPVEAYHVAINGQAAGPYDLAVLKQMAMAGQFNAASLVWKAGMAEWTKAGDIEALHKIIGEIPPAIPIE